MRQDVTVRDLMSGCVSCETNELGAQVRTFLFSSSISTYFIFYYKDKSFINFLLLTKVR